MAKIKTKELKLEREDGFIKVGGVLYAIKDLTKLSDETQNSLKRKGLI